MNFALSKKFIAHKVGAVVAPLLAMWLIGVARKNGVELQPEEVKTMFEAMAGVSIAYLLGQSYVDTKTAMQVAKPVEDPANKIPTP